MGGARWEEATLLWMEGKVDVVDGVEIGAGQGCDRKVPLVNGLSWHSICDDGTFTMMTWNKGAQ